MSAQAPTGTERRTAGRFTRPGQVAVEDRGLRRDVGRVGLLFAGVGSIIGSGWLFGALTASTIAGPAAIISWLLGGVMVMLIGLCYAELGAMIPVSGGVVRYPHFSFGSLTSYTSGWITWIACVTTAPIEVLATLTYATNYVPWLTDSKDGVPVLTGAGYAVAVALLFLFCLINAIGVRAFARFNNVLVWWKLAIISIVVVAFFVTAMHPGNLTDFGGFAPNGTGSIFSAVATAGIVFSYLGFRQGVELAGESSNPKRNVPLAVIGSVVITIIIYTLLQIAFIGALPAHTLQNGWSHLSFTNDFGPLAGLASLLGLGWLAVALYVDAIVSPADTGLIYTATTSRIAYAMGRNRNAPSGLAKLNKRGVPWVAVLVTFILGLVVFLPFPSWQKLVGFITSATVLSFSSGPLVLAAMRRQLPDQERPFKLPFGDTIPLLAFIASNLIVFWAGWDTNYKLLICIVAGWVLFALYHGFRRGEVPALEWRAASWIVPWLAGLMVISLLGDFGKGLGVLSIGWGALAVAGLSCVIYALALRVRLPGRRVIEAIQHSPHDEPPAAAA
jgi:amino acid transporter